MPFPSTTTSPREVDATFRSAAAAEDGVGVALADGEELALSELPLSVLPPDPLPEEAQPARARLTAASATASREIFLFMGLSVPPTHAGTGEARRAGAGGSTGSQESVTSAWSSTAPVRADRTSTEAMSAIATSTVPTVCTVSLGPAFQLETTVSLPSCDVTVSTYCHGGGLL